jgi:hypothetical protein
MSSLWNRCHSGHMTLLVTPLGRLSFGFGGIYSILQLKHLRGTSMVRFYYSAGISEAFPSIATMLLRDLIS